MSAIERQQREEVEDPDEEVDAGNDDQKVGDTMAERLLLEGQDVAAHPGNADDPGEPLRVTVRTVNLAERAELVREDAERPGHHVSERMAGLSDRRDGPVVVVGNAL